MSPPSQRSDQHSDERGSQREPPGLPPISRRWFVVLSAGLLGAACQATPAPTAPAPDQTTSAPATTAKPVAKEQSASELVYGHPVIVPNLDPHAQGYPTAYIAFRHVYDELTRFDYQSRLQPWLASEWTSTSPTTWEFKLRPGITFSNGEPLDAAAVKWSFDRVLDTASNLSARNTIITFSAVEAPDPTTVRIITRAPDPLVPERVSTISILPPRTFEAVGQDAFLSGRAVGSGPFQIREFVPNQRISFEATSSWRGTPSLASYRMEFITDRATLHASLMAGQVDIAYDLTADQVSSATASGFQLVKIPQPNTFIAEFDTLNGGPLQRKEVRQAMNYALDREALTSTLLGGLGRVPGGQMVTPEGFGHNPSVRDYPFDVAKAKQLLAEAGYPNGFETKLGVPPLVRPWAEAFQGYQAAIGIRVELVAMEFGEWIQTNNRGPILPLWGWIPGQGVLMDGDEAYQWWYSNLRARPESRITFRHERFDTLFEQQRQEMNREKRLQLLQELAQIFHDEAPAILVYNPVHTYTMSPRIERFVASPDGSMNFDSMTKRS